MNNGLVTVDFIENDALKSRYWWNPANGDIIKTSPNAVTAPKAPLIPLRM
jgi:hypothetical protein